MLTSLYFETPYTAYPYILYTVHICSIFYFVEWEFRMSV